MPRIPSSVLPLFSVSRTFGGLFFGVKLVIYNLFNPSDPPVPVVPEYSRLPPTRTAEIHLPPTRCIPGPSSSSNEFPYAVFLGFAAVIASLLVCVLCTKFQTRPRPPPPLPPPSPPAPPKHRLTSHRNPWMRVLSLYLTVIVFGIPVAHHIYYDNVVRNLYAIPAVETIEKVLLDGWQTIISPRLSVVVHHIVLHWQPYCKTGFLALASHALGVFSFLVYRRLYAPAVIIFQDNWLAASSIISIGIVCSTSKFNYIVWFSGYYCKVSFPSIHEMHHGLLGLPSLGPSFFGAVDSHYVWMLLGPISVNVIMLYLLTVVLIIRAIPWAFRTVLRFLPIIHQDPYGYGCVLLLSGLFGGIIVTDIAVVWLLFSVFFWSIEYHEFMPHSRELYLRSFISPDARRDIQESLQYLLEVKLRWKAEKIQELQQHGWELRNELWEALMTWNTLHRVEKLIIVAPVAMLYGYFYVIPAARKLRNWYVNWRFRLRRARGG